MEVNCRDCRDFKLVMNISMHGVNQRSGDNSKVIPKTLRIHFLFYRNLHILSLVKLPNLRTQKKSEIYLSQLIFEHVSLIEF